MTVPEKPEAQVVSVDAGGRKRVHFAGLLEDAVEYVKNNFPRIHIEPGGNQAPKADVFIEHEQGNVALHGSEGFKQVDAQGNVTEQQPNDDPNPSEEE